MTALAWKLNRVRCMSAAEIGTGCCRPAIRAERWGLVPCEVPEADLAFTPTA